MKANGHLINNTPIAVDIWVPSVVVDASLFFLSHAHADHMVGLKPTWNKNIYTSPITAKLLIHKIGINPVYVHALEIGDSHLLQYNASSNETVTVTLLDANHCPGAVVFIFEGYFGTLVYTGDFRYEPRLTAEILQHCTAGIDVLYFDNTYNNARYEFPPNKESTDKIIKIIEEFEDYKVKIGVYSIGRENMLIQIAKHFEERIDVSKDMFKTLETIGLAEHFKTTFGRIAAVMSYLITDKQIAKWRQIAPTIIIIPSAFHAACKVEYLKNKENVFYVPYSNHSSFSEINCFIKLLQPRSARPIISNRVIKSSDQQIHYHQYISRESPVKFAIPRDIAAAPKSPSCVLFNKTHSTSPKRAARKRSWHREVRCFKAKKITYSSDSEGEACHDGSTQNATCGSDKNPSDISMIDLDDTIQQGTTVSHSCSSNVDDMWCIDGDEEMVQHMLRFADEIQCLQDNNKRSEKICQPGKQQDAEKSNSERNRPKNHAAKLKNTTFRTTLKKEKFKGADVTLPSIFKFFERRLDYYHKLQKKS